MSRCKLDAHGAEKRYLFFGSIANLVLASPDAATAEKKIKACGVAFFVWRLILE